MRAGLVGISGFARGGTRWDGGERGVGATSY